MEHRDQPEADQQVQIGGSQVDTTAVHRRARNASVEFDNVHQILLLGLGVTPAARSRRRHNRLKRAWLIAGSGEQQANRRKRAQAGRVAGAISLRWGMQIQFV
ncbi:hypothetical protein [Sphingomonas parapaucimobilis]|uniref:Uncharacterized protein n=1 Tax=Sphingomonas parapaucimobilis NBRC 15100 TaxID=1219049 RepID=A0A0A1W596_9SPHN|nr:hypothetical protein [Sphingomonas parapaucimobilis]GAM00528.1 hypothetical protein SP5_034_01020 [Sphingomonas parapaucimobilis NBRC 15100]